ncbi:phage tail tape measure protein [Rouxiella badensis]|uniref:phage tail tape measure protein n=1 Tax=Rouxiella badensis TaxID=1646377 RepID=UPI001D15954B|nr:phage tail tape measure protein [Rouxiella badensis]MCC3720521.1 phage tail tape measure protein [Rouxiella badensis]MCC3730360.1 phage tail tape measure protein [Rouxiella badensis]MCC3742189.1 phage tail tape measure protein [Rouxiella badensis]
MASKSLGTLTIDLIAKVGGFVDGMNQAERSSEKWRKQVEKDAGAVGTALGAAIVGVSSAVVGLGVSALAITKSVSESVIETDRWAKSLGVSTTSLQQWQYAATKAGLTGDNIADIFKDLNDKIGDAVLNKSGEAAQALDTLGLSAKKLQNISPDKQLLAISSAMKGMNTAQKTTIFEALGNDLSKMIPLLDNGAEGLKKVMQEATDKGIALPQSDIDNLVAFNGIIQDIDSSVQGLKNQIAAGLAHTDLSGFTKAFTDLRITITDPQILQSLADIATGIVNITTKMINAVGGVVQFAHYMSQISSRFKAGGWYNYDEQQSAAKNPYNQGPQQPIKIPTGSATLDKTIGDFKLGAGESNQKTHPKKDTAGLKLENSFKATEMAYQRQIALIDTTGKKTVEVTEQQKLAFDLADGKLVGLNQKQKERLSGLAKEIDRLNDLKKLNQENLKLSSFISGLKSENNIQSQTFDANFIGAGMGETSRSRAKELLGIQLDFVKKQQDLQKQYQKGEIEKSFYDKGTDALRSAMDERIEIQKDYYKKSDEQKNDWQSGISDALNDFADKSTDYYQQAADAMTSIMGSASNSISNNLVSVIEGTESMGDALKNVFADLGSSVIKALADMAAQWLVYQAVQLLVGKTAQSSAMSSMIATAQATSLQAQLAAYASTAAIPIVGPGLAPAAMLAAAAVTEPLVAAVSVSSLAGMAHDGVDAVPETGTWLLQKGERVTTAKTSAKLDATLERVSNQSAANSSPSFTFHQTVNGDPDARTLQMLKETQKAAVKEALQQSAHQIATGTGPVGKSVGAGWNTKRRTG